MSPTLTAKLALFTPDLPLERASTVPNTWYTDPEIAAWERKAVFGANWVVVGRTDQVTQAGDFLTCEVAGEPLLIVRSEDMNLRGFFNVCRHRAARVACGDCGTTTRFRCPYHGWTYDLTGQLRGLPEFEGVADFHREENGLVPIEVATWGPLVFAHLGQPRQSLTEFLAPMPEKLAPFRLEKLHFLVRKTYELACNWKVFVDNYLDGGYHVNYIHPSLASVLDYKQYRTETFSHCSVQSSPMKAPDAGDDTSAATVRQGTQAAYWWLYPNLMLNAYEGVMDTNLVLPLGPDRCRVIFDFYFADDPNRPAEYQAQSMKVADQIQSEDVDICEDVQRGLHSRAFVTGRYSVRREVGVWHFHQLLAKQLLATVKG
jgi:choline monooxygenase